MDEHVPAIQNNALKMSLNDPDCDPAFRQSCRLEDRSGVVVKQVFNLGVADERQTCADTGVAALKNVRSCDQHCRDQTVLARTAPPIVRFYSLPMKLSLDLTDRDGD